MALSETSNLSSRTRHSRNRADRCRLLCGVLFVGCFASAMTLLPTQALASCGDYLYRNGKPVSSVHHSSGSSAQSVSQSSAPTPGEGRCSGPFCSSRQDSPLRPLPNVEFRLLNDSGMLCDTTDAGSAHPAELLALSSDRASSAEQPSVFRPPRNG